MKQRQMPHRQDQRREAQRKLEMLLLEGLNSGEPVEANPKYWERKRARLAEARSPQNPRRPGKRSRL